MKTTIAQNTAIAIMDAPKALASLDKAFKDFVKADIKADTAMAVRATMVRTLAAECEALGWADLSAVKPKGAHHDEFRTMIAAAYLTAQKYAVWAKTMGKGSRGTAPVLLNNIVRNRTNDVIKDVEAALFALLNPAPQGEGEGEGNGANANKAKDLDVYFTDAFADHVKRNGNDARKPEPTGKNHAAIKAELERCAKVIADLLK